MDSMAQQFDKLMKPRIARLNEAAHVVAVAIDQQAKDNSEKGMAFRGDRYDAEYTRAVNSKGEPVDSRHMKLRRDGGFQVKHVDLRMSKKRIEKTLIVPVSNGMQIEYESFGDVLKYHHDGVSYKNGNFKMRSIFPKRLDSIPDRIHQIALKAGKDVLG